MTKRILSFVIPVLAMTMVSCASKMSVVTVSTEMGDMKLVLHNETEKHKENFEKLVKDGFYNGTTFHRVINTFMIQGGDPLSKDSTKKHLAGNGGPGYTIEAEILSQYRHYRGALAAARSPDNVNPKKASNGSQFYIVDGVDYNMKMLDATVAKVQQRDPDFHLPDSVKTNYCKLGGSPWLDGGYTVFGQLISGYDVLDKIAAVKTNNMARPGEDITMTCSLKKYKKKAYDELIEALNKD